jgi:hypothetical protein
MDRLQLLADMSVGSVNLQKGDFTLTEINSVYTLAVEGQASGTPTNGTIVFSALENLSVYADGDVVIESVTRSDDDIYRQHSVAISCPNNGSGNVHIRGKECIVSLGNHGGSSSPSVNFYTGNDTTSPKVNWNLDHIPNALQKIRQMTAYSVILYTSGGGALPTGLTYLALDGNNINWTYSGALPTGLTYLRLNSNNINWTYSGTLPTGLTSLLLDGNNINWTYSGALPTGLTYLYLNGSNINWTYSGTLPTGLTFLYLIGSNINWTYSGTLPTGLTFLYLNGSNINWTYSGTLPTGLTYLLLIGNNINWTYSGALPTGLTYLYLIGSNINWTYSGTLPTGLTSLYLNGSNINWTYSGTLPTGLRYLQLNGNNINWTSTNFGKDSSPLNYSGFLLLDYRNPSDTLTAAELITILQNLMNRVGNLPATVYVREYDLTPSIAAIQAATANETGTDAEKIKYWIEQVLTKTSTFQLNTTDFT